MEQELWYLLREQQRLADTVPRCDEPEGAARSHRVELSRRLIGRAVVRVGELIAAERYVPVTR